ncbi:MAG: PAS domain-containing protein [Bacteroidales bacterium]|jgi:transcriptional regulator with PAS, ATPase and Fis domain|nr:PAS domain-containing protein [Bacteroidales bacterium]
MEWIDNLDGNVIVCNAQGTIIYMNNRAARQYAAEGGFALIGRNLMDCHGEASREKIRRIMETHQKNVYTIEKRGKKKIIYQSPWMDGEEFKGIIEFSLEIPFEMKHYKRE